jgi:FAD/FMN-containing dehydrogenase
VVLLLFLGACARSTQAGEVVNDITQLNPIKVDRVVTPRSIEEISALVRNSTEPLSIGGGRNSQGGQTATENCLQLDMRSFNKILALDPIRKTITVQAGITWREDSGGDRPL